MCIRDRVQVDAAKTALDVANRTLEAMRADRSVIAQQMSEGAVLAPAAGRILSVPVSEGQVILPGETIATLAEDRYILRLQLPERHAQFMRAGDKVLIGSRGLGDAPDQNKREGRVRVVYPEIHGGRVIADGLPKYLNSPDSPLFEKGRVLYGWSDARAADQP